MKPEFGNQAHALTRPFLHSLAPLTSNSVNTTLLENTGMSAIACVARPSAR